MRELKSKKARRLARKAEMLLIRAVELETAKTDQIPDYWDKKIARFGRDTLDRACRDLATVRL